MTEDFVERIDFPNGETCWYIDKHPTDPRQNHSYWAHNPKTDKKGRRLTGVTTAVKTLDYDPSALLKWAAKTQCIGIADLYKLADGDGWLIDEESIWRELEANELTFEHVRDRAAKRGTNVHRDAFEALAKGRPTPDFEALTPEEIGHAKAISAFWLEEEPEVEQVEQVVYSSRLGVAGRLDFRGQIKSREGTGVLDLKTGFISTGAHAQVGGGYPLLADECGFGPSKWALILQTKEDGTYELIEAEATPDAIEAAVKTYRAAGQIKKASKDAWVAARRREETAEQIEKLAA
jgi:hypothetical protein